MRPDSARHTTCSLARRKTLRASAETERSSCSKKETRRHGEIADPRNHAEGNDTRPYGEVQYETEQNGTKRNGTGDKMERLQNAVYHTRNGTMFETFFCTVTSER